MQNFTEIRPVAAESFHAGGRTDRYDEAVVFHYFTNAPNIKPFDTRHMEQHLCRLALSVRTRYFSGSGLPGQQAYHTCKIKSTFDTACLCFNCI